MGAVNTVNGFDLNISNAMAIPNKINKKPKNIDNVG